MPTPQDTLQEQGFRTSLLGFDKNDVLAYMNDLANETRERELASQQQIGDLQAQLEKLQGERAAARQCVEKLQAQLTEAEQRATQAEQQLADAERRVSESQGRYQDCQKTLMEWQFKCRDLQQQLEGRPELQPPEEPSDDREEARLQARKILADARLYAQNAEKQLQEQAQEQQQRMTEHARGIAAGVLLLRSRLARVDEKIGAVTLDLENATAGIYQALDEAEGDLDALGAKLKDLDAEDPIIPDDLGTDVDLDAVEFPTRPRVTAQAVPQPRRPRPARPPQGRAGNRLRRSRVVSQELRDAMNHFEDE